MSRRRKRAKLGFEERGRVQRGFDREEETEEGEWRGGMRKQWWHR